MSGVDGRRLMGPGLWGTQRDRAADIISKQMHVILPKDSMGVHAASSAPSYSSRKMGASAGALLNIGWQAVVVWSCGKSHAMAQLYADNRF